VVDGFDFGAETLTIVLPGKYRIEVRNIDPLFPSFSIFSMSRHAVALQQGSLWRAAEASATESKRTGKLSDITASLSRWKELNDVSAVARTYIMQGDAVRASDNFHGAREAYEEALRLCGSDLRCAAEAANNSGSSSSRIGDLEAASQRLREAAAYWRGIFHRLYEGRTLLNLGFLYWQSGDYEHAIEFLDQARHILEGRDASAYAQVQNNLGLCYQSLSEYEKSIAYFQPALAGFVARHEQRYAIRARFNLGRSYMLLGKLAIARDNFEHALGEAERISDLSAKAFVLDNLGQVLLKLRRWDEARTKLEQALTLHRSLRARRGEAIALHYLGIEAGERGDNEAARQSLTAAARIRQESGLRDDASESVFALAELEYRAGNFSTARELSGQAIALIETLRSKVPSPSLRASYYSRKRRFFDLLIDIAMAPANPADAGEGFLAAEQAHGRSVLDLIAQGAVGGKLSREQFDRRTAIRRQLAVLAQRLTDPDPPRPNEAARLAQDAKREGLRQNIQLLLGDDNQLDAEIRKALHLSALGRPLGSVAELQASLPTDSALLEYYLGERQSYLWLVLRESVQSFRLPPRSTIETLASRTANRFGQILDRRRSPQLQAAFEADLRRLSGVLLGSLRDTPLPARLILVLDGALHRVPMAALRLPNARESLGLSFDLVQAPSAAYLLAGRPPRPASSYPGAVLALADPVFSATDPRVNATAGSAATPRSNLPRLAFTAELDVLAARLSPTRLRVLKGFDAAPASLRRLKLGDFAVLHWSTHAFIDDRIPELSRVALSMVDRHGKPVDGYIRPHDFADFRLDGSIVVLSSCETALGKEVLGEGLAGFSSSLLSAGASQLVVALTKVDAEASSVFFAETYRRFFGPQPAGMEHALTEARRTLARSARWSDPYYWASFTIVGTPTSRH
jgi:CHAT domain-containing protein/tetratricopeptide (TPR) repeat protein